MCSMPPYACWPVHYLSCVGPAIAPPAFGSHEFAYLGYDAVLDSAPVRLGLGLLGLGLGLGLLTLTLTLTLT